MSYPSSCILIGKLAAPLAKSAQFKIGSTEYWQQLFAKQDTVDYPIVFVRNRQASVTGMHISRISGGKHFSMRYNDEGELQQPQGHSADNKQLDLERILPRSSAQRSVWAARSRRMPSACATSSGRQKHGGSESGTD